ncbi:hypothetical protein D9611_000406 [Ephemerocybe angulata]|uniref:Vacuolar sorting protein Vps3844 C-terminal domain-containing protein n=1 Tax=Ephemerocybe angulata TaxID=980116 RepID=A0A8H5F6L5_9AGAR|nr:hypothetical protein D9611_000406 [Tulosesus angulatus]
MVYTILLGLLAASTTLVNAGNLYLYPQKSYAAGVESLEDASAAISRHLGLDMFEPVSQYSKALLVEEDFVGTAADNYLLLTLNEEDAHAVLPQEVAPAGTVPMPGDVDSLSSVVSTYLGRAAKTYPSVFENWLLTNPESLLSFFNSAEKPAFAGVQASELQDIRERFGSDSAEYSNYTERVRQLLETLISEQPDINIAVLTYENAPIQTRDADLPRQTQKPFPDHPLPQEPIGAISACFTTAEACKNSTNSCSGHGNCVAASKAGRSCFVCACGATTKGEGNQLQTTHWAGQSCERKDISSTFALLAGTVLVLIIVIYGSTSLLYTVGDQALPSILLATAVNTKKD